MRRRTVAATGPPTRHGGPYVRCWTFSTRPYQPRNIDVDKTERINDALAELNPELYGTGCGDGGGNTGPPTLDGSLDTTEFPGGSLQKFGASISASGNIAVVGALGTNLGDGSDEGVAQVLKRSNDSFTQAATLTASRPGDPVGESVAVDGNAAIVGMPGTNSGTVEVYIYSKTGGRRNRSPEFTLTNADNETEIDEGIVPTFDPGLVADFNHTKAWVSVS